MNGNFFSGINPDILIYFGTIGLFAGITALIIFIYRRIRRLLAHLTARDYPSGKLVTSLRNLLLILVVLALFGMIMFIGFFLRTYHVFTEEVPVATAEITPGDEPQTMTVKLTQLTSNEKQNQTSIFVIRGDQWLLEGDILKWDDWLYLLGLQTRYRFTRIRGRYVTTENEIQKAQTVYSLVEEENHPIWQYLYHYGHKMPFVSTVYGNAVFQYGDVHRKFQIYITPSGFVVREYTL